MTILNNDWSQLLEEEFNKTYYKKLRQTLKQEYNTETIYPDMYSIFNALHHTPYHKVKVVIIGQDPYHGPNQAHGLSFSVQPGIPVPPSLKNIYKELQNDIGCTIPNHGYLLKWTEEGVLLLNTTLTVRKGQPSSHRGLGWELFTDKIIEVLNEREKPVIFILWGRHAQEKQKLVSNSHHFIIESPHPSPFSANRGFFGSNPFSKANSYLRQIDSEEIDWQIDPLNT
ncbi:uracil-DNA glycosylase [Cytobacillus sp. IB215316]|uniref:uracil-DNA glycosylase n=1 Tax=Cytobacillus sp. IB215316 TaxID=3097354 RepID=UPI002A0FFA48|nr:uracil-DNA glycosylase [Cytobacillus sp. IB215316]MDX8361013.1 uracil-DNA glycosylase [Cytobacillus sp. IB215316]